MSKPTASECNVSGTHFTGVSIRVPYFDIESNAWSVFEKQLKQFFIANGLTDDVRKKAIMLTSLSENAYKLLENLLSPNDIESSTTTVKMCIEALAEHFKATTSSFAERCTFYNAVKSSHESINDWAARVRSLAVNCDFAQHLNIALRDKFVMGLEKGPARDKIFLESVSISLERAMEIANTTEYILQQHGNIEVKTEQQFNFIKGKQWQRNEQQQNTQRHRTPQRQTKQQEKQQQQQLCNVCGYSNHKSSDCVKAIEKRDGAGAHNWGSVKQQIDDINKSTNEADATLTDKDESSNEQILEQPAATDEDVKELTLDEWKALRGERAKPQYNIRKPNEGEDTSQWKKMVVLNKKKEGDDSEEEYEYDPSMYPQRVGRLQRIVDIQFNFNDGRRGGGGLSRGRGRGLRPGIDKGNRSEGVSQQRQRRNIVSRQRKPSSPNALKVDDESQFPTLS